MEGKLPEIYWYVFWIGVVVISFTSAWFAGKAEHETRKKGLDILRMYAEKGTEPPPAMLEQIFRRSMPADNAPKAGRGALVQGFVGFLFMACAIGGLHYWLTDIAAPSWAIYASQAGMAFFGFGSFGFLLVALFSRDAEK